MEKKKVLIYCASGYGLHVAHNISDTYEVLAFVDNCEFYKDKLWGGYICRVVPQFRYFSRNIGQVA